MSILLRIALLASLPALLAAQTPTTLDGWVEQGLRDNLGRRSALLAVSVADAARAEATGRWLPTATVNARYSRLGGNVVNLGRLINPAFGALNGLLGQPAFPTNVDLRLPLAQETTVRLQQVLFAPAISAGVSAATAQRALRQAEADGQARELAAQVRTGYLDWARATQAVAIWTSALGVLDEQLRVTERLVATGLATPDAALRVRAERSAVAQSRDEAARLEEAARQAFNVLVDRPLDAPLALLPDDALGLGTLPDAAPAQERAGRARAELRQLDAAGAATDAQARAARSAFLPTVAASLDYGWQGNAYDFQPGRDFSIGSIVLSWSLFNGGQDQRRVEAARLESERYRALRRQAERQVSLEVAVTHAAARVADGARRTAQDRVDAAQKAWDLVRLRRETGAATLLEALDARHALTQAQLNRLVTTYDYYQRCAQFERAAALYPRTQP